MNTITTIMPVKKMNQEKKRIQWMLKIWANDHLPHMPQPMFDDDFLMRILVNTNFKIDHAKDMLAYFHEMKIKYDDFSNMPMTGLLPSEQPFVILPLPKLMPSKDHILLLCVKQAELGVFDVDRIITRFLYTAKVMESLDPTNRKLRIVKDCTNTSKEHLERSSPYKTVASMIMIELVTNFKITGLTYINTPPYMVDFIQKVTNLLPIHMSKNIKICYGLEGFFDGTMPKSCFPMDYGGTLPSVQTLLKKWDHHFTTNNEYHIDDEYHFGRIQKSYISHL